MNSLFKSRLHLHDLYTVFIFYFLKFKAYPKIWICLNIKQKQQVLQFVPNIFMKPKASFSLIKNMESLC